MKQRVDITALFQTPGVIEKAIRKGAMEAMKQYIMAGESMVSGKDGQIVEIPPEELKRMLAELEEKFPD